MSLEAEPAPTSSATRDDYARRDRLHLHRPRARPRRRLGCVYIYPSRDERFDADVRSWVRADVAELDAALHAAVSRWLAEDWPFAAVDYADRG